MVWVESAPQDANSAHAAPKEIKDLNFMASKVQRPPSITSREPCLVSTCVFHGPQTYPSAHREIHLARHHRQARRREFEIGHDDVVVGLALGPKHRGAERDNQDPQKAENILNHAFTTN